MKTSRYNNFQQNLVESFRLLSPFPMLKNNILYDEIDLHISEVGKSTSSSFSKTHGCTKAQRLTKAFESVLTHLKSWQTKRWTRPTLIFQKTRDGSMGRTVYLATWMVDVYGKCGSHGKHKVEKKTVPLMLERNMISKHLWLTVNSCGSSFTVM